MIDCVAEPGVLVLRILRHPPHLQRLETHSQPWNTATSRGFFFTSEKFRPENTSQIVLYGVVLRQSSSIDIVTHQAKTQGINKMQYPED